jgi:transposase-like protein
MLKERRHPDTLAEAIRHFAEPETAFAFVVQLRWPNGVVCPHCNAEKPMLLKTRMIWKCRVCRKQFSVKVGTIFEDSALGLDKWLPALWMLANCKNGISSYELGRALGVTQKSAWFMLSRIRLAMQTQTFQKMKGAVEIDETFIGGIAVNMHHEAQRRRRGSTSKQGCGIGILEPGRGNASRVAGHHRTSPPDLYRDLRPSKQAPTCIPTSCLLQALNDVQAHDIDTHELRRR